MAWNDDGVNPVRLVNTQQGNTVMFGIESITRRAIEWNRERKHRALKQRFCNSRSHVQKDIGWPAYEPAVQAARQQRETAPARSCDLFWPMSQTTNFSFVRQ
jgi:hypothetical protein